MIPDRPTTSSLSLAEWRAAFRVRNCAVCGTKIVPSERTHNPSVARTILRDGASIKRGDGDRMIVPAGEDAHEIAEALAHGQRNDSEWE